MRKKRVELEQDVIIAARTLTSSSGWGSGDLKAAVKALDKFEAAELTGAGAKYTAGSDTSQAAAGLAVPVQYSARQQIIKLLAHLGELGLTDDQMETRLRRSHQTVSSARNWLVEAGWVRDSGQRRKTRSGRMAVVWMLTDTGVRQTTQPNWKGAR